MGIPRNGIFVLDILADFAILFSYFHIYFQGYSSTTIAGADDSRGVELAVGVSAG
jgi:hypothetical protein